MPENGTKVMYLVVFGGLTVSDTLLIVFTVPSYMFEFGSRAQRTVPAAVCCVILKYK